MLHTPLVPVLLHQQHWLACPVHQDLLEIPAKPRRILYGQQVTFNMRRQCPYNGKGWRQAVEGGGRDLLCHVQHLDSTTVLVCLLVLEPTYYVCSHQDVVNYLYVQLLLQVLVHRVCVGTIDVYFVEHREGCMVVASGKVLDVCV